MNISMKQAYSQIERIDLWLPTGKVRWGEEELQIWCQQIKSSICMDNNNKVLLYSTGNYVQYPMIHHNGKEYKLYIYIIDMCILFLIFKF